MIAEVDCLAAQPSRRGPKFAPTPLTSWHIVQRKIVVFPFMGSPVSFAISGTLREVLPVSAGVLIATIFISSGL